MKILIAEDDQDIREIVRFEVKSVINAQILEAKDGAEAIELLNSNSDIEFIICDYNMPQKNGGEVYQHLISIQHKAVFILCSARTPKECDEFRGVTLPGYAAKPDLSNVGRILQECLRKKEVPLEEPLLYVPVRTQTLLRSNSLFSDVYVKLSDVKYVAIMKKGDLFTKEDLDKYLSKDVVRVYIKHSDAQSFSASIGNELSALIEAKDLKFEPAYELSQRTLDTIQNCIQSVGVTAEVQELTKKSVELSLKTLGASPDLAEIFKRLNKSDLDYIITHSLAVGYIACYLASLLGWNSETTLYKLVLAAQLHDVTLGSHLLHRARELDLRKLGYMKVLELDERSFFVTHPLQAAALVREFQQHPPEVDVLVAQHHERPDGSGFPNQLKDGQIAPLSGLLMVAHDFYSAIIEEKKTVQEFIVEYPEEFKLGITKKIMLALTKANTPQS